MPRTRVKKIIFENERIETLCIQFKRNHDWGTYQRICEASNNLIDSIIRKSRFHRKAPFQDIKHHLFVQFERWIDRWVPGQGKIYTYMSTSYVGCTKVMLADGSYMRLDEIVNGKLEVMVKAFDPTVGKFVDRRVTDWHRNPVPDRKIWRRVSVQAPGGNHIRLFATFDHPFYIGGTACAHQPGSEESWKCPDDLGGENLPHVMGERLTNYGKQAVLGMWLGDGCVSKPYLFSTNHCNDQKGYAGYTASKMGAGLTEGSCSQFHDDPTWSWGKHLKSCWPNVTEEITWPKKITPKIASEIDGVSLAYWFMDDGSRTNNVVSLHTEGFTRLEADHLQRHLFDTWGFETTYQYRAGKEYGFLRILGGKEEAFRFSELVAPHIHPSMDYKLYPEHRNQFVDQTWIEKVAVPCEVEVAGVVGKGVNRQKTRYVPGQNGTHYREWYTPDFDWKYDITVEGDNTRNFLVEGDGPNPTPVITANCIKHGAISYVSREKLHNQRLAYTDKPLDALSTEPDSHAYEMDLDSDMADAIISRLEKIRVRWQEPIIQEVLRYTIATVVIGKATSRRREILRTITYGWPSVNQDTAKFLLDWSTGAVRNALLDMYDTPLKDEDIIRVVDKYSFIPDVARAIGWQNTRKLMETFAGVSIRFPSTIQRNRHALLQKVFISLQRDPSPENIALLAKKERINPARLQEQVEDIHESIMQGALTDVAIFDGIHGFPREVLTKLREESAM